MTVSFSFAEIIQISPKQAVNMALENSLDSENALYKENIKNFIKIMHGMFLFQMLTLALHLVEILLL